MAAKTIAGRVDHEVEGITEDSKEIILDARDLTVEKVLWKGVEIPFNYEKVRYQNLITVDCGHTLSLLLIIRVTPHVL